MRIATQSNVLVAAILMAGLSCATGCNDSNPEAATATPAAEKHLESGIGQPTGDHDVQERESKDASQLIDKTAQDAATADRTDEPTDPAEATVQLPSDKPTIEIPKSWTRLGKDDEIWIDKETKQVIIAGHVCLNTGPLEMFICPQQTKEHESVISANATALQVHLSLIALGAEPGKATSWDPEYRAAFGPTIDVTLKWHDEASNSTKSANAKQWIRDMRTKKPLQQQWVFGGSQFWEDPDSNEKIYYGDSGELICLSNFSTATIDLNVESSQSNDGLLFEAFTENIPPLGTKVYALIKPGKRIEPSGKTEKKNAEANSLKDRNRATPSDKSNQVRGD